MRRPAQPISFRARRAPPAARRKLTEADVLNIRAAREERERLLAEAAELTARKLAEKFGVHPNTIEKVLAYSSFRWVR